MNTDNQSARVAIHPCNSIPFAFWYDDSLENDHPAWAINDENGDTLLSAPCQETAQRISNAMKLSAMLDVTDGITLKHFYDLRALAMSASAMTRTIDEDSDELNAVRRVLSCLADKALEFANEIDHAEQKWEEA